MRELPGRRSGGESSGALDSHRTCFQVLLCATRKESVLDGHRVFTSDHPSGVSGPVAPRGSTLMTPLDCSARHRCSLGDLDLLVLLSQCLSSTLVILVLRVNLSPQTLFSFPVPLSLLCLQPRLTSWLFERTCFT